MSVPWYNNGLPAVLDKIVDACSQILDTYGVEQSVMQASVNGGPDFPATVRMHEWTGEGIMFELCQFTQDSAALLGSHFALWVNQTLPEGPFHYCQIFNVNVSDTGKRSVSCSRTVFSDPKFDNREWHTTEDGVQFSISRETTDEITWQHEILLGYLAEALAQPSR